MANGMSEGIGTENCHEIQQLFSWKRQRDSDEDGMITGNLAVDVSSLSLFDRFGNDVVVLREKFKLEIRFSKKSTSHRPTDEPSLRVVSLMRRSHRHTEL